MEKQFKWFLTRDDSGEGLMEEVSTYERVIFRQLFSVPEGLDIFYFHERYQLSPAQLYAFISEYSPLNYAHIAEDKIYLTQKGKFFVWKNRFFIFENKYKKSWRPNKETKGWKSIRSLDNVSPHYKWIDKKFNDLNKNTFLNTLRRANGTDSQA